MLLLRELERQILADRQGLIASGVREDLPSFQKEREAFYERLTTEPQPVDQAAQDRADLHRALKAA